MGGNIVTGPQWLRDEPLWGAQGQYSAFHIHYCQVSGLNKGPWLCKRLALEEAGLRVHRDAVLFLQLFLGESKIISK